MWTISRFGSAATFFLHTDSHVKDVKGTDYEKEWTDRYFDLLTRYDEFTTITAATGIVIIITIRNSFGNGMQ